MIEPALKKTAIYSIILHLALFILAAAVSQRSFRTTLPSPYIVRLVSPARQDTSRKQPVVRRDRKRRVQAKTPSMKRSARKIIPEKSMPDRTNSGQTGIAAVEPAKPRPAAKPSRKISKPAEPPAKASVDLKKVKEKIGALRQKSDSMEKVRKRIKIRESVINTVLSIQKGVQEGVLEKSEKMPVPSQPGLISGYYREVKKRIWSEWVYPDFRKREGLEAVVKVRILKDGRVVAAGFERSSGDRLFDSSTLRAITKASPLPQPPFEMEVALRFRP